jgi:hypothetical protein
VVTEERENHNQSSELWKWFVRKLKSKIIGRMKSKVDPESAEFSMTVPRDMQIYGGMRDDLDVEGMEIGHDERHQHLKHSLWL